MIDYYFRLPSGQIVMSGQCNDEDLYLQKFEGATLEVGKASVVKNYYKNGELKEYPEKPYKYCRFNYNTEQWEIDLGETEKNALEKRDLLLSEGPDRINPLWWSSMTTQEQQAWTQYRQDLLDITKQAYYPEFIVWPIKP